MGMIPISPWLFDLRIVNVRKRVNCSFARTHLKVICERTPWRNGTLRDTNRSVHMRGSILIQAMKVKTCGLIPKVIYHVDNNTVSNVGCDIRDGPLTIDAHHWPFECAIRICSNPPNSEIICLRSSSGRSSKGKKEHAKSSAAERRQHPALRQIFG